MRTGLSVKQSIDKTCGGRRARASGDGARTRGCGGAPDCGCACGCVHHQGQDGSSDKKMGGKESDIGMHLR